MNAHAIAEDFANRLCRERPLTEHETDMLCRVLADRPQRLHRLWTAEDKRELGRLATRHNAREIAAMVGRTVYAVRRQKALMKARSAFAVSNHG